MFKLKINYPLILLRNIGPANELCNNTRLVLDQASEEDMFLCRIKRKKFSNGLT